MLVPHLYLDGKCEEAIAQYIRAFHAEAGVIIRYPEDGPIRGVLHAEIYIHGQRIMLNDLAGNNNYRERATVQVVVIFDNQEELRTAYEVMKEGSNILSPMQATDYSTCAVELCDRFGVQWGFMVASS